MVQRPKLNRLARVESLTCRSLAAAKEASQASPEPHFTGLARAPEI